MNDSHWQVLLNLIQGKEVSVPPVGLIIDSPWLPGWYGISTLDYFTDNELWFQANKKAIETFPEAMFLPGFWSEFGMCTEPSAFGAKSVWQRNDLPFAKKVIDKIEDIDQLGVPNPETDGLAPFMLNRLTLNRKKIEQMGHKIRFAVARGPLNVASFLMGATELLISLRTDTRQVHKLLEIVTEYTVQLLQLQKKTFDTIDGVLILDDIVGFCGEPDFKEFAEPYLKQIFGCLDVAVRFFHNDAEGKVCAPHLAEIGINMFNFSFLHSLNEMKQWTNNKVVLVGNIPPRDVLALGKPEQIRESVNEELKSLSDRTRILWSCGGAMSGGISTENVKSFIEAVQNTESIKNSEGEKQ